MIEPATIGDWIQAVMVGGALALAAVLIGRALRGEEHEAAAQIDPTHEEPLLVGAGAG
jgi:hypothetical protein